MAWPVLSASGYAGALYHLTARGDARTNIFADDDDRRLFPTATAGGCRKEQSIAVADIKDSARDGSKPAVCGAAGTPCQVQGQELTPTLL